ncbi:uncharacterized protein EI90DRAFT_3040401, partial [Cantharellus anzutake]|uniref:uncharacterized protein n=1 Tax=Cantharellus anzutake TaxID=1750568 RepID=UPI00190396FB
MGYRTSTLEVARVDREGVLPTVNRLKRPLSTWTERSTKPREVGPGTETAPTAVASAESRLDSSTEPGPVRSAEHSQQNTRQTFHPGNRHIDEYVPYERSLTGAIVPQRSGPVGIPLHLRPMDNEGHGTWGPSTTIRRTVWYGMTQLKLWAKL